ncbi:metal ABC transporter solute-binding protein, Zn/Mn family [Desulfurivibrio sp. D14AmB]|uniref:metal ABC transporter solute-binding protein, Zn/Mn family n=1 Tax=Desulfurivibrio sp. D14AmB TaxID=3374370 RepID=UPI00376EB351
MIKATIGTRIAILLLLCATLWVGAPPRQAAADQLAVQEVTVGIPPLAYLVKRIGGDLVKVTTLIPAGQDPHSFEPSPGQVAGLSRSTLYFSLDMPFERTLLARIATDSRPRVIEAGRGIVKLPMPEHHHDHDHVEDPSHGQGELDPHIWLDPQQLLVIAQRITDALGEQDPARASYYLANQRQLQHEIEALHARLGQLLAPLAGRTFYVYHPAFGYFANAYDLRQRAVEIGGKTPAPRQLINLIDQAHQDGVRVIFVQPQFDRKSAAAVARAINGVVVPLDPLTEDVLANLAEMAARIHQALGGLTEQQDLGDQRP